jgi:hypothetical protein
MSDGQIYDSFDASLTDLISTAENVAQSLRGQVQRMWRIPPEWDSSPTDIQALGTGFLQDDVLADYGTFFNSDTGTASDCMSAKLQSDHLSMQERSWRMRQMTHVRAMAHSAGRRNGQAQGAGSFGRIYAQAQDLLAEGD